MIVILPAFGYCSIVYHRLCGRKQGPQNSQFDVPEEMTAQTSATPLTVELKSLPWWRHEMEIFSALLAICAGNSMVFGEFPAQRPVTRSLDVLFDLRLNKRLSKQSSGWWFETPSCPLWRHRNDNDVTWASCCLKSSVTWLFANKLLMLSAKIHRNSVFLSLCWLTVRFPSQRTSNAESSFKLNFIDCYLGCVKLPSI